MVASPSTICCITLHDALPIGERSGFGSRRGVRGTFPGAPPRCLPRFGCYTARRARGCAAGMTAAGSPSRLDRARDEARSAARAALHHHLGYTHDALGVQGDRIDPEIDEKRCKIGEVAGSLSADAHLPRGAMSRVDHVRDGLLDGVVSLVEERAQVL